MIKVLSILVLLFLVGCQTDSSAQSTTPTIDTQKQKDLEKYIRENGQSKLQELESHANAARQYYVDSKVGAEVETGKGLMLAMGEINRDGYYLNPSDLVYAYNSAIGKYINTFTAFDFYYQNRSQFVINLDETLKKFDEEFALAKSDSKDFLELLNKQ